MESIRDILTRLIQDRILKPRIGQSNTREIRCECMNELRELIKEAQEQYPHLLHWISGVMEISPFINRELTVIIFYQIKPNLEIEELKITLQ